MNAFQSVLSRVYNPVAALHRRLHRWEVRAVVLAGLCALFGSGVGCIGFRGGELQETRPWPPIQAASAKKPAVSLSLVGRATWNSKPAQINPGMADAWLHNTRETYVSSGLFSEVRSGSGASDLKAEIEVLDAATGSKFLFYATGLTLGVIPSCGTDEFTWTTTFKDGGGNVRGVIEKKESATMWMEILLLFGMPFSTPASAAKCAMGDLNRSTLHDALQKGYLNP
jgi:hypothetical protein